MRYSITITDEMTDTAETVELLAAIVAGVSDEPAIGGIKAPCALLFPHSLGDDDTIAFYAGLVKTIFKSFYDDSARRTAIFMAAFADEFRRKFGADAAADMLHYVAESLEEDE